MAERMEDLEEGEITDSDTDNVAEALAPAPAPAPPVHRGQNNQPQKPAKMKVPGLSSDEDDGNSSEDDIPFKKQFQKKAPTYSDEEEEFQNPLRAAKESGFECDRNYWLDGAFQSTKRGAHSGPRKRVNNIWGSVLQEEELSKGMGGLQNQPKSMDERGMGVESYDWRRSEADPRPYVEPEENSNDENPEPDLEGKESFGTLKTKPRRIKERLGKRDSEQSDESDSEARTSAKLRLGSRTDSRSSEDSNQTKKHRNSPIDPAMDDSSSGQLEHRKLHDRIREHQSSNSGRYQNDRRDPRHYEDSREERRNEKIQQNRKRRADAKSVNQRNKAIQYVPMKQVDINVDMDADTIGAKLVESLGEPEEKKVNFARAVNLVGAETVLKLLRATEDVEEMGGLTIQNGMRRRTPGGVFFFLMKNDKEFTKEVMDQIFQEDREEWKKTCKERKKEKKLRDKERLRKLKEVKEQQEGVNFEAELKSYKSFKKEVSQEQTENGKGKEDEMEEDMEEAKDQMESEEKEKENPVADDLFDAYAEDIELDVL